MRASLAKRVLKFRLNLVLEKPGLALSHRAPVRFSRNCRGFSHDFELGRALNQSRLMQKVAEVYQLPRHGDPGSFSGSGVIDPVQQFFIKIRIAPEIAVDLGSVLQKIRQDIFHVLDGKCVIRFEVTDRAIKARAIAVPHFLRRVVLSTEHEELAALAAWRQHRNGLGFIEAREVEEVAISAIAIVNVAVSG